MTMTSLLLLSSEKAAAYRPPQARGGNAEATKPLEAYEPASNDKSGGPLSKNAKKKAAKKAKAAQEVRMVISCLVKKAIMIMHRKSPPFPFYVV